MSDSDDTDVLLLIPPDFFNVQTNPATSLGAAGGRCGSFCVGEYPRSSEVLSSRGSLSFVPSVNESVGIQSYKSSLATMSGKRDGFYQNGTGSNYGYQMHTDGGNMYYSTPIKGHLGHEQRQPPKDQYLLNEIDNFLQIGSNPVNLVRMPPEVGKSPETSLIDMGNVSLNEYPSLTASDFNGFSKPTTMAANVPQKPPRKELHPARSSISTRPPLLSLNEIWNTNAMNQESSKVQEERLRRQHCERNIQALQMKLLEFEQKIAVAIDVDKEKEGIILRQEEESLRLNHQLRDLELKHTENHEKLLQENLEIKNKNLFLEKEHAETITAIRKLQDKNEALESKVESLTTANRDVTDVHKHQLKDLEIRLSNSRDSERSLKEQLSRLKKSNEQLKDELEVERKKVEESSKLRGDFVSLKVKTDNLSRKFADVSALNETYKEQIKELKSQIDTHLDEKKNLLKELDVQRMSLKKYYQSQLEDVVGDKLKEFQKQLTSVEDQLKTDAKRKERLLAERAIKQIELINQTNEQEIKLLNEKYNEQESLYRLQLTNSSKTIHELEEKLTSYQSRRVDIAEQLHSIMEVQWQKALEVLTSPATVAGVSDHGQQSRFNKLIVDHIDKDQLDGVRTLKSVAENETFQTPTSSRQQKMGQSSDERNILPRELLHNYIELLLEKSPNDLKDLEDVLSSCRKEPKGYHGQSSGSGLSKQQQQGMSNSAASLSQLSKTLGKTPRPWK